MKGNNILMKERSRTYNSMRNVIVSVGVQIGTLLINFISRTVFIKILGAEYLGINGLFTNVLTLLSLAELGVGNAIIYSMYKPIANKDENKIAALMGFYKNVYRKIAIIVLVLGIVLIPFLKYIVNTDSEIEDLYLYYLLFLTNTVASYFFIYKSSMINADQKMYIQKIYYFVQIVIQFILQVIVLIITHNFLLYLAVQIICTIGNNIALSKKADKLYPYINNKVNLSKKEKKSIYSNVNAMFIYKISGTILNNTDNILISILVGTVWVGYYSNYFMIISAILSMGTLLFSSFTASIGNLNASTQTDKKIEIFNQLNLLAFLIFGFFMIGLGNLFDDFITLWIGKEFILDKLTTISIAINFYIQGVLNPIWIYRDTTGLFKDTKWMSIVLAIINLVLSIILGRMIGLAGILMATFISRILTSYWYQPYMLYKNIFKMSSKEYFLKQVKYNAVLIITYIIVNIILSYIPQLSIPMFILKGILVFIITVIIFTLAIYKDEETRTLLNNYIIPIMKKIKNKIKLLPKRVLQR